MSASRSSQRNSGKEQKFDWIHLKEGKDFSRILYPNPVCFLCTCDDGGKSNVMAITWLTATNNRGRFMMSLNRRRHTANVLSKANQEFALCVPIAGMEDLILAVGSTSGKFGCKFIENHTEEKPNQSTDEPNILSSSSSQGMSKRQKKKKQHEDWAKGIPGLARVHIGESRAFRENLLGPFASETQEEGFIFCIQGTIAHMRCRTYAVMEEAIDEEHYLVLGEVIDAFCHSDYWEASKKLFRPKPGAQPYLTFFGSQTFGRVFAAGNCD